MVYEYEWDIISINGYIKINGIYIHIYIYTMWGPQDS